jgi:hypothetical protein
MKVTLPNACRLLSFRPIPAPADAKDRTLLPYRPYRLGCWFSSPIIYKWTFRTGVGLTELSAYFFTFHTFFKNYLAIVRNQDGQYGFGASRSFSVAKSPYSCLIKSVRLVRSVRQSVRSHKRVSSPIGYKRDRDFCNARSQKGSHRYRPLSSFSERGRGRYNYLVQALEGCEFDAPPDEIPLLFVHVPSTHPFFRVIGIFGCCFWKYALNFAAESDTAQRFESVIQTVRFIP